MEKIKRQVRQERQQVVESGYDGMCDSGCHKVHHKTCRECAAVNHRMLVHRVHPVDFVDEGEFFFFG